MDDVIGVCESLNERNQIVKLYFFNKNMVHEQSEQAKDQKYNFYL